MRPAREVITIGDLGQLPGIPADVLRSGQRFAGGALAAERKMVRSALQSEPATGLPRILDPFGLGERGLEWWQGLGGKPSTEPGGGPFAAIGGWIVPIAILGLAVGTITVLALRRRRSNPRRCRRAPARLAA